VADPFKSDDWDWPYILYIGRVWLRYTEKEIWQLTPRQFKAQLEVHADIQRRLNGAKTQMEQTGYIDQLKGW
jgi:hypothetical protein